MQIELGDGACETRTLANGANSALVCVAVPSLAQTLLVQVSAIDAGARHTSLYVAYREAGMTFEVISSFDAGARTGPLDAAVIAFVRSADFDHAVLRPLRQQVSEHFGR